MIATILNDILLICDAVPDQLRTISANEFCAKPLGKWSKKEILGHLIDSAAVNLQRFIRGQLENSPRIYYEQDKWVAVQDYQHDEDARLIILWESLNRHLVHVVSHIPDSDLVKTCTMKDGKTVTLAYLAEDYLSHLKHHLEQILK